MEVACMQCRAPLGDSKFVCEYCGTKTSAIAQSEADEGKQLYEIVATVKHLLQAQPPAGIAAYPTYVAEWRNQQGDRVRDVWITADLPSSPSVLERAAHDALDSVSPEAMASPLLARSQPVLLARAKACAERLARVPGHEVVAQRLLDVIAARRNLLFPPFYMRRWVQLVGAALLASVVANVVSSINNEQKRMRAEQVAKEAEVTAAVQQRENATALLKKWRDGKLEGKWRTPNFRCRRRFEDHAYESMPEGQKSCYADFVIKPDSIVMTFVYVEDATYSDGSGIYRYKIALACEPTAEIPRDASVFKFECQTNNWHEGQRIHGSEYVEVPYLSVALDARLPSMDDSGNLSNKGQIRVTADVREMRATEISILNESGEREYKKRVGAAEREKWLNEYPGEARKVLASCISTGLNANAVFIQAL
jgi:hypothetical protein